MQEKLKSLLRKTSSRKKEPQSQHAKHDSGTATSDGRQYATSRAQRPVSEGGRSNQGDSNVHQIHRKSLQRPLSVRHEPPVTAADYNMPNPEEIDDSVADNYRAYLPAISPGGNASRDSRYMSLGGDTRHITGTSEMKHSEDIADRNIDMYGSSSRHGSLPSQKEVQIAQDNIGRCQPDSFS